MFLVHLKRLFNNCFPGFWNFFETYKRIAFLNYCYHKIIKFLIQNIIQLLTNEALDMMWYRPENTKIDRGEASLMLHFLAFHWQSRFFVNKYIAKIYKKIICIIFSGRFDVHLQGI